VRPALQDITGDLQVWLPRIITALLSRAARIMRDAATIRDYLRHSNLHATNKYSQSTTRAKGLAQDRLVDAILPTGLLPTPKVIQ